MKQKKAGTSGDRAKGNELETPKGFLKLYNRYYAVEFRVVEHSDIPDILCRDTNGQILNLEITRTLDRELDIAVMECRSDSRSKEVVKKQLERVRAGLETIQISSLPGTVSSQFCNVVQKKLYKNYGPNTALVVQDTSPVNWDWDLAMKSILEQLDFTKSPFAKGIWILNFLKTKLYKVDPSSKPIVISLEPR